MAVRTVRVCDLCERMPAREVVFEVDDTRTKVDLCEEHIGILLGAVVDRPTVKYPPKEVRAWAVANGYEVSAKGRIPPDILRAFREAQASAEE